LQRLLTTITLVGLLIATAAAFAITERLKLTKSPIANTLIYPKSAFSPTCGCTKGKTTIRVRLRRADAVTLRIVDSRKHQVRTVVEGVETRRGFARFRWDGRTDRNVIARDGLYRAEIHLARQHRTILLPNRIRLDTRPPEVQSVHVNRDFFSPDGDKQADFVRITYELSKPAHVLLYLDDERILRSYRHPARGSLSWLGDHLPAGTYTLYLGAVDSAGNSTPIAGRVRFRVTIRYIELAAKRLVVKSQERFEIGVATDAKRYTWKLGKRHGTARTPVLSLEAPQQRGRYTLTVEERGHVSRAAVIVR
jgi:hypothetical protein